MVDWIALAALGMGYLAGWGACKYRYDCGRFYVLTGGWPSLEEARHEVATNSMVPQLMDTVNDEEEDEMLDRLAAYLWENRAPLSEFTLRHFVRDVLGGDPDEYGL